MLKGCVKGIVNNKIQGWAFDTLSVISHAELILEINDTLTRRFFADIHREDIKKFEGHPTGFCGFEVDISDLIDIKDIRKICVRFATNNQKLTGSPVYISDDQVEHNYFFLHIPKTAGTSFRMMLETNVPASKIFPNQSELNELFNGNYPTLNQVSELSFKSAEKKLFIGHYPFGSDTKFFGKPARTIVFLRDPIARTISNIKHVSRHFNGASSMAPIKLLDRNSPFFAEFNNRQVFMLSGGHAVDQPEQALSLAKNNLSRCFFIGLTETFNKDISRLACITGWDFGQEIKANFSTNSEIQFDESTMNRIHQLNQLDIELYQFAKQLLLEAFE